MIKQENKYTNVSGTYPNALMIDASGAGLTDGSEFAALPLNDGWEPFQQAIMDYANGSANSPTGTPGTPNGVADAAGVSQILQAFQVAHGIGPGKGVIWLLNDDPSTTGDRVLLLSGQGVLIAAYPELDAAVWCTDVGPGGAPASGYNAQVAAGGGSFYRSSDSAGTTPNIAGPYLQLPDAPGRTIRVIDPSAGVDPDGASRYLGDVQVDSFQDFQVGGAMGGNTYYGVIPTADGQWFTAAAVANTARSQFIRVGGQGASNMITAKNDGTNGTPRTSSETRMTNFSIKLGITY